MQRWYADDEPGRNQKIRAADSGQGEDRRSRLERGLRALSRNDERVKLLLGTRKRCGIACRSP